MYFRGCENAVALTLGQARQSDSVRGLSCVSCVSTEVHVYSHVCKDIVLDDNLVHLSHIRAFGTLSQEYCYQACKAGQEKTHVFYLISKVP